MGRPAKPKEDQRQQLGFRVSPSDRVRLEEAARRNNRSVPQEIEARIVASLDRDQLVDEPTAALLDDMITELGVVQRLTGKRWHKDALTWAAVHQMCRQGPLQWRRPDRHTDDEIATATWEALYDIQKRKKVFIDAVQALGVTISEKPFIGRRGLFGHGVNMRAAEEQRIKELDNPAFQQGAMTIFNEIKALDEKEAEAEARYGEALAPHWQAEREGREVYRAHRRKVGLDAMDAGEPYNFADVSPPAEVE